MNKPDYEKIDPIIRESPNLKFKEFSRKFPGLKISPWSFIKRRKSILVPLFSGGINDRPSLAAETGKATVYTSVWSCPMKELRGTGLETVRDLLDAVNRSFQLHLEPAVIEVTGSRSLEIRRYSR